MRLGSVLWCYGFPAHHGNMSNASCRMLHSIPVRLSTRVLRLTDNDGEGEESTEPEGAGSLSPVSEGVGPPLEGEGSTEPEGAGLLSPVSEGVGPPSPEGEESTEPEGIGSLSPVSEGAGSTELRGLLLRSNRESRGREERTAHTWMGRLQTCQLFESSNYSNTF